MHKDIERAFGVLVSRWGLQGRLFTLWDRAFAGKVMKAYIFLHNMIVEARQDGYENELWALSETALEKVFFLDENGVAK